jgi:acetyltransferase-like isoleucine patch superfamily enzyme
MRRLRRWTSGIVRSGIIHAVRRCRVLKVKLKAPGRVTHGRKFIPAAPFKLGNGRSFSAGNRVSVGPNFWCMSNVSVGDDVMISSAVSFVGDDHKFDDPKLAITAQEKNPFAHVVLEGDNLIGHGTIVVGTVRIGQGAIVGTGSLVTTDLPPNTVCVGRPARPIRSRYGATGGLTDSVSLQFATKRPAQ